MCNATKCLNVRSSQCGLCLFESRYVNNSDASGTKGPRDKAAVMRVASPVLTGDLQSCPEEDRQKANDLLPALRLDRGQRRARRPRIMGRDNRGVAASTHFLARSARIPSSVARCSARYPSRAPLAAPFRTDSGTRRGRPGNRAYVDRSTCAHYHGDVAHAMHQVRN